MFLCCSYFSFQQISALEQPGQASNMEEWHYKLTTDIIRAADTLQISFPLVPDDNAEAIALYKSRILKIVATQPAYLRALLILIDMIDANPVGFEQAGFDVQALKAQLGQFLTLAEQVVREHLSEDEQDQLAQLSIHRGVAGDIATATSVTASSLFDSGWKFMLALGAVYLGYQIMARQWAKQEISNAGWEKQIAEAKEAAKKDTNKNLSRINFLEKMSISIVEKSLETLPEDIKAKITPELEGIQESSGREKKGKLKRIGEALGIVTKKSNSSVPS